MANINPSSRSRSLIPASHLVDPAPRSLPLLPTRRFSLSRSPVSLRKMALVPPRLPRSLPRRFLFLVPGYLLGNPLCVLTLSHMIARRASILVSSMGLRANPCPHSLKLRYV
jgi:hypothetical protein